MNMRICPLCGSENVKIEMTALTARGIPAQWECGECGFKSVIFPERKMEVDVK